jgi:hypothetical protein
MMWTLFLVAVVLLIILSRTKFEVRHEITLDASVEKVWQTVIDFEHYSQWNTQLSYLGGKIAPNEKLHLKLAVEGATPYEFKPTVSQWKEREVFGWIAITGLPRVFDGEHFFELNDLKNGKTLLINREEYRGILSLIMQQLPMMKLAPKGFEKMNLELKNFVEAKQ